MSSRAVLCSKLTNVRLDEIKGDMTDMVPMKILHRGVGDGGFVRNDHRNDRFPPL